MATVGSHSPGYVTLEDWFDTDEKEMCIKLTEPDGGVVTYPYEDSSERRDQQQNARDEAEQYPGAIVCDFT